MSEFTRDDLAQAHRALTSVLHKCEKCQDRMIEYKPQATLLKNRIAALRIALALIEKEMADT